jgi:hypothetical protein
LYAGIWLAYDLGIFTLNNFIHLKKAITMKRILFGLFLLFVAVTKLSAQTTDVKVKYWYYPSQNVYYNETTADYWYYDGTTSKWVIGKTLPATYAPVVEGNTRYPIYYVGSDIWKYNKNHKVKYKVKKDGTVKTKIKPNDG